MNPIRASGIVTDIKDGIANVAVFCSPVCEGCSCSLTHSVKHITLQAKAGRADIEKGDAVVVATKQASAVRDALIVFVLPVALFFGGYEAGSFIFSQAAGIAAGIVLVVLPFIYLFAMRKKSLPIIEQKLEHP
jgi:positive regulator of sigma E activity